MALYSSRTRGVWNTVSYIVKLAPKGWLKKQEEQDIVEDGDDTELSSQEVKGGAKRSAWARLINKVYGINPLICNRCGSEMRIVAFIIEPEQIDKIMEHLKKNGRSPPGIDETTFI